jgi:malate/lactate dehydrogenase
MWNDFCMNAKMIVCTNECNVCFVMMRKNGGALSLRKKQWCQM